MRSFDLPPHSSLWQSITPDDELRLYRWIDEAFGQLLYHKRLWTPSVHWSEADDVQERDRRAHYLLLLRQAYNDQLIKPLEAQYGPHAVSTALSDLNQTDFVEPAVVWESVCSETGETVLDWMAEKTADVLWPGLVSCGPSHIVARRYWESEARRFAKLVGGKARGMADDGSMVELDPEIGEPCEIGMDEAGLDEARKMAEAVLVKEFIAERENQTQN